jgi:hypothetical protein
VVPIDNRLSSAARQPPPFSVPFIPNQNHVTPSIEVAEAREGAVDVTLRELLAG